MARSDLSAVNATAYGGIDSKVSTWLRGLQLVGALTWRFSNATLCVCMCMEGERDRQREEEKKKERES